MTDAPRSSARSGFLDRFYARLSDINPLLVIVAYGAIIIVFGAFYWSMPPGAFYAPYVKYEPAAIEQTKRIELTLATAIRRQLDAKGEEYAAPNGWSYGLQTLRVVMGTPSETPETFLVPFIVSLAASRQHESGMVATFFRLPVTLSIKKRVLGGTDYRGLSVRFSEVDCEKNPAANPNCETYNTLFNLKPKVLLVAGAEETQLRAYIAAAGGEPATVDVGFPRMLYFSIVVATTLGLGDIVPLTTPARMMVGAEAFLGVLLAGLFLNAVFHRGARSA
jgi:hypothetical protein